MIRPLRFATVLLGLLTVNLAWPSAPAQAADEKSELPIRRVVMFNSGVTYFEHFGQVEGDTTVDLKFRVDDVNDLLKSMVLQDLGGGDVSTVSYGSKDPITRALKTFAIDLTTNPTLAGLLQQIRGEEVMLEAPNPVRGKILGVEKRRTQLGDKDEVIEIDYLNLVTEDGLVSVSLQNVGRIKLANPKLDAELRQALMVLATSNSTDKKTVTLNLLGKGARPVRVGYIQESPVWKTSYRMVLADKGDSLLQGWAIVENTTEEDWSNVDLSLVSGRPISFVMDLYEPLYVTRPEVFPELYSSLRPRTYDQDLAKADADFRAARRGNALGDQLAEAQEKAARSRSGFAAAPAAPPRPSMNRKKADEAYDANFQFDPGQGIQSMAAAGDVGELFRYHIGTPVSIDRSRSAMLPIVNEQIKVEKVSIYNPSVQEKHPLNGMRLKNTTKLHLMQGPITVFDGGVYAGDAQIQAIPPGSERLISYALDLATEVAPTSSGQPEQLLSVRLVKGTLYTTRKYGQTHTWVVKNSSAVEKTVLIEYPINTAWTLVSPKEPTEKTRNLYRFAVKAAPGEPAKLDVKEERTESQSVAVTNLPLNQIQIYLSAKVVDDEVKAALQEVIKRKQEIELVRQQRQEHQRQLQVIATDQDRIRRNMAPLPQDSEIFRKYLRKFTEQEDELEGLQTKVTQAIEQEQKLQKSLDDYLIGLNLS